MVTAPCPVPVTRTPTVMTVTVGDQPLAPTVTFPPSVSEDDLGFLSVAHNSLVGGHRRGRVAGCLREGETGMHGFRSADQIGLSVSATLKITHKAIGAEVRRGTYDIFVDGKRSGSVEMNSTIEIPVDSGRHALQIRDGRKSSSIEIFDAVEGDVIAFRCTGKRFLPIFLASFVVPKLALKLVRD